MLQVKNGTQHIRKTPARTSSSALNRVGGKWECGWRHKLTNYAFNSSSTTFVHFYEFYESQESESIRMLRSTSKNVIYCNQLGDYDCGKNVSTSILIFPFPVLRELKEKVLHVASSFAAIIQEFNNPSKSDAETFQLKLIHPATAVKSLLKVTLTQTERLKAFFA